MSRRAAGRGTQLQVYNKGPRMTEKTTVELSNDVWNAILAMALEHPIPRHAAFAATQALQQALIKAQPAAPATQEIAE